jgi:hypothetical protein
VLEEEGGGHGGGAEGEEGSQGAGGHDLIVEWFGR